MARTFSCCDLLVWSIKVHRASQAATRCPAVRVMDELVWRTSSNNETNLLRDCQLSPLTDAAIEIQPRRSCYIVLHFLLINIACAIARNIVLDVSGDLAQFVLFKQRKSLCRLVCHTHIHISNKDAVAVMCDQTWINSLVALEFCLISRVKSKIVNATLWLVTRQRRPACSKQPADPSLLRRLSCEVNEEKSRILINTQSPITTSATTHFHPPRLLSNRLRIHLTLIFLSHLQHSTKWASGTHSQGASRNPKTHP